MTGSGWNLRCRIICCAEIKQIVNIYLVKKRIDRYRHLLCLPSDFRLGKVEGVGLDDRIPTCDQGFDGAGRLVISVSLFWEFFFRLKSFSHDITFLWWVRGRETRQPERWLYLVNGAVLALRGDVCCPQGFVLVP